MADVTYIRVTAGGATVPGESGTWIPVSALELDTAYGGGNRRAGASLSFSLADDDAIAGRLNAALYASPTPLQVEVATYDDATAGAGSAGTLVSYAVSTDAYLTSQSALSGANTYGLTLQSLSQTSYADGQASSSAYGDDGTATTPTLPPAGVADGSAVAGSASTAPAPSALSSYVQFTDSSGDILTDPRGNSWFEVDDVTSSVARQVSFAQGTSGKADVGPPSVSDVSLRVEDLSYIGQKLFLAALNGSSSYTVHLETVSGSGGSARVVDNTTYNKVLVDRQTSDGLYSLAFVSDYSQHLDAAGNALSAGGYDRSTGKPVTSGLAVSLPTPGPGGTAVDHFGLIVDGVEGVADISEPVFSSSRTVSAPQGNMQRTIGSPSLSTMDFSSTSGALSLSLDPTAFVGNSGKEYRFNFYGAPGKNASGGDTPGAVLRDYDTTDGLVSDLNFHLVTGEHDYSVSFANIAYGVQGSGGGTAASVNYDTSGKAQAARSDAVTRAAAQEAAPPAAAAAAAPAATPGGTAFVQFRDAATGAVVSSPSGQSWFAVSDAQFGVSRTVSAPTDGTGQRNTTAPSLTDLTFTLGPNAVTGTLDADAFARAGLTVEVASYGSDGGITADYVFGGGALSGHGQTAGSAGQMFSYSGVTTVGRPGAPHFSFQETRYADGAASGFRYDQATGTVGAASDAVAAGATAPAVPAAPTTLDTYVRFVDRSGVPLTDGAGASWFRVDGTTTGFGLNGSTTDLTSLRLALGDTDVATRLDAVLLSGQSLSAIDVASYGSGGYHAYQSYSGVKIDGRTAGNAGGGNAYTFSYTGYGERLDDGSPAASSAASTGGVSPPGTVEASTPAAADASDPASLSGLSFYGKLSAGGTAVFAGTSSGFVALPSFTVGVGTSGASFSVDLSQSAALAAYAVAAPSGTLQFEVAGYDGDGRSVDYILSGVSLLSGALDAATGLDTVSLSYAGFQETKRSTPATSRTAGTGPVRTLDAPADAPPPVCFCSGVRILTARGEVAVEALEVGDLAVTASGAHRPVRWIGRQTIDCAAHPRPQEVMPVRVQAGALGPGRPARDLWVSPGHALCLDLIGEVLVPASALVNGATVAQVEVEHVTYWHVELDGHDVLLADGVPAESYIDTGNRAFFGTGRGALDPERAPASLADYCRPFHDAGPLVAAARAQLRLRAGALGWRLGGAPLGGLHLAVDGARAEAEADGLSVRFAVPAGARDVWLCSDVAVPLHGADDARADARPLGLCVAGLGIDDGLTGPRAVAPADPRLDAEGWHAAEPDHRWTAGRARLDPALWAGCRGLFFLRVELARACLPGWRAPEGVALCAAPGVAAAEGDAPAGRELRLVRVA